MESVGDAWRMQFGDRLRLGADCQLSPDVRLEVAEGALLVIGDRVTILRGTTIQVNRNATVVIGNDVAIGENVFMSAMIGIRMGDGSALASMVEVHDHNHRVRSYSHVEQQEPLVPWASGFVGAPIIIESGALISNKVTLTAGVRIGQNSIIGANSVATSSIGPNMVASGVPARPHQTFDGPLTHLDERQIIRSVWFGTSIMEHYEGYNARIVNQSDLPDVGSNLVVEGWHKRGYVQRLALALQAAWPYLGFEFDNRGSGGATSRDVLQYVQSYVPGIRPDLAFFGCGINDVWRRFQGRTNEAVDIEEYAANYRAAVRLLVGAARKVICIGETPFGWDTELDIDAMNHELRSYNEVAARIAAEESVDFIDTLPTFAATANQLGGWVSADPAGTLWSDGVHMSELGDALLLRLVQGHMDSHGIIATMTRYERRERTEACAMYRYLFADVREDVGDV